MKISFTFTNSEDPDEMQHYAAFHLGLHCLKKYSFRGFPEYNGLIVVKLVVKHHQACDFVVYNVYG